MRIGICGAGTVASGVVSILRESKGLEARLGSSAIQIAAMASRRASDNPVFAGIPFELDVFAMPCRADIDVIVELIGGIDDALRLVKAALSEGKSVVTANKALLAHHGAELMALAQSQGVALLFEAAVCGGIPIIKALNESFVGNNVRGIAGIINGTTNFILTKMAEPGANASFETVLSEAQRLGYAEADPTFDIGGMDAAHKLAIMAALAFDEPLQIDQVFTEGIQEIDGEDLKWAERLGYKVKHLGIALADDTSLEMRVHPALVPDQSQLASIQGVTNAVNVLARPVGETLFTGPGAGAGPTGSSVVSDLFDLARGAPTSPPHSLSEDRGSRKAKSMLETKSGWMVRLSVRDRPGMMSQVGSILADHGLSIDQIQQRDAPDGTTTVVMILDSAIERDFQASFTALKSHPDVMPGARAIRVFDPESIG
ncbi:MAG: homoserine dehydrogenase [Pseudomonadales bacterium]